MWEEMEGNTKEVSVLKFTKINVVGITKDASEGTGYILKLLFYIIALF